ncbi:hypothetical protein ACLOJK_031533 [Asimina triloba]
MFAQAGLKIWLLTGDKKETAINIGFDCSLLRHVMQQLHLSDVSSRLCLQLPALYQQGQKNICFSWVSIFGWIMNGVYASLAIPKQLVDTLDLIFRMAGAQQVKVSLLDLFSTRSEPVEFGVYSGNGQGIPLLETGTGTGTFRGDSMGGFHGEIQKDLPDLDDLPTPNRDSSDLINAIMTPLVLGSSVLIASFFRSAFSAALNFAGVYANCFLYRLGDVVKVMGFHNSTPELQFVCRRGLILTVNIDKNTEKDLQLAVEAARKVLAEEKVEVIDFTSHADTSTDPGHYAVFWELSGQASEEALNECCACLDGAFKDAGYVSARKVKAIGALELRVVREGTFRKVRSIDTTEGLKALDGFDSEGKSLEVLVLKGALGVSGYENSWARSGCCSLHELISLFKT